MHDELIVVRRRGRVATIELSRPGVLNTLNDALMDALGAVLLAMDADSGIGCIVLTGNEKAFAAGADIAEMQAMGYAEVSRNDLIGRNWETILRVRKPVLAAVAGYALGGGCELVKPACAKACCSSGARFTPRSPRAIRRRAWRRFWKNVPPTSGMNSQSK